MKEDKPIVIMQNWSVTRSYATPYTAPELVSHYLCGEVYGHPRFEDGSIITSSRMLDTSGNMVETNNTWYELKEPDVTYTLWCEKMEISLDPSSYVYKV